MLCRVALRAGWDREVEEQDRGERQEVLLVAVVVVAVTAVLGSRSRELCEG